jgi:hypothetical protein
MVLLSPCGGGDSWLKIGTRHGSRFVGRQVQIELFIENNGVLFKGVLQPELTGNLGLERAKRNLGFEYVTPNPFTATCF